MIALYFQNAVLLRLVSDSLDQAQKDYITLESVQALDINKDQVFDIVLTDQYDHFLKSNNLIGFFAPNSLRHNAPSHHFSKIITLPFRLGFLIDQINYVISQQQIKRELEPIKMGQYTLYPQDNSLLCPFVKSKVSITDKESAILLYLYQTTGRKVERDELLQEVWGYADSVETHTLETHIYRLRQKIEKNPSSPLFLLTDDDGYYLSL